MMAWGQAGVGMPHNSTEQYAMFPHVPMNQLQPGDLILWDGHVGIYVGGGMMIHAPHTGDVVQIAPIYGTTGAPPAPADARRQRTGVSRPSIRRFGDASS